MHDLLLQQVFLIKEEDDRRVLEPGVSDDGPEQSFAFLHTILSGNRRRGSRKAGNETPATNIRSTINIE